jgi:hypothetical protein
MALSLKIKNGLVRIIKPFHRVAGKNIGKVLWKNAVVTPKSISAKRIP